MLALCSIANFLVLCRCGKKSPKRILNALKQIAFFVYVFYQLKLKVSFGHWQNCEFPVLWRCGRETAEKGIKSFAISFFQITIKIVFGHLQTWESPVRWRCGRETTEVGPICFEISFSNYSLKSHTAICEITNLLYFCAAEGKPPKRALNGLR